jgi:stalled ribosome rescue protein Dom34
MHVWHAVVWTDHREARVFFFDREGAELQKLTTTLPHHQTHNKAGTIDGKRNPPDESFYHDVALALEPAKEWLILGPGSAHIELADYIRSHHPQLAARIIGVEAADHPTDGQIVAHGRAFFRAADRMLPI